MAELNFSTLDDFFREEDNPGLMNTPQTSVPKTNVTQNINADACELVKDLMPSYVDCSCSGYTRDFVSRHIDICPTCRALANNMGQDVAFSKVDDIEGDLHRLKKTMKKIQREKIIAFTAFFTAVLCAICFYFIASAVRKEVNDTYYGYYVQAVREYESERSQLDFDPFQNMQDKWESAKEKANAENSN
ncbi:MAG: zf-HC2 domain-containing protein [Oscillospiraceae bacterium]|nr:zf-HC2 domain-containing protein [Oscillospiraceae bacterium]